MEDITIGTAHVASPEPACRIWPNPVGEELLVYGEKLASATLQILDSRGGY